MDEAISARQKGIYHAMHRYSKSGQSNSSIASLSHPQNGWKNIIYCDSFNKLYYLIAEQKDSKAIR
jgi:hypothetical protein